MPRVRRHTPSMSARITRACASRRNAHVGQFCVRPGRQSRRPPWPGRIGGHDKPTQGGGQRAARVRFGGDLSANGGSGLWRDVNDNRHSAGDSWAAGQPVGALEEALGRRPVHEPGRSEGGVDGTDRAGTVAHRSVEFHRPGPDVADSEDQRLAGLERQRAAAQLSPGHAKQCAIQLGAGEHEAVVIDSDVLEPAGSRGGAYKAEQTSGGPVLAW